MNVTFVLVISILLQFTAAFLALRLIRVTGRRRAWILIALAVSLMAIRRCITLFHLLSGDLSLPPDPTAELVAFATSVLMLAGIAWIAPLFLASKRSEEALRKSEEKYRHLVEEINEVIYAIDKDGVVTYISPVIESLSGYKPSEIIGRRFSEFVYPEDLPRIVGKFQETLSGLLDSDEYRVLSKSGETHWVRTFSRVIFEGDQPVGLRGVMTGIAERKLAEEALKRRNEELMVLNAIATAVSQSLDLKEVLEAALKETLEVLKIEGGLIYLFDEIGQIFAPAVHQGISQDVLREVTGFKIGEGLSGRVAESDEPLIVADLGADPRNISPAAKRAELRSYAGVPIKPRDKVLGVMTLVTRQQGYFGPDDVGQLSHIGNQIGMAIENARLYEAVQQELVERKRAEEELRQRNRELAMLNRANRAFTLTLELDQVLTSVLEEVRNLLGVVACSAWLADPKTGDLVCRQVTEPQSETVRGWRLAPGEGVVGWVASSGKSLIVPDAQADERHFEGVDRQTGLKIRSILSVPLRVRQDVIGVLQVVDTEVDRFNPTDVTLVESLAATAAIAIENAWLYEQARRDAETKTTLLREVNHRVKNNLSAIIGLLYAERSHAGMKEPSAYRSIMEDLVNRVQGLATAHSLLSASEWKPLLLSELASQVIHSSLQALPRDKSVSLDVTPSPVRVTADQAHNLALVINELTTNTIKHALQERDTAHITMRIVLNDDTILCEFRTDGPGYPEEVLRQENHSVGFDLVRNIVRKSLQGELSLYNDRGPVAKIRFKSEV